MGGTTVAAGAGLLRQSGVVSFDSPTDVVDALDALAHHAKKSAEEVDSKETPRLSPHLEMYGLEEMRTILDDYDMHLEGVFVKTPEEVEDAIKKLGDGPFAIKAISKQLVHKSDLGAVRVHLADTEAVHDAWKDIEKSVKKQEPEAVLDGMLLQRMVSGVECIIGVKRDAVFGPVVVFGLGGIYVELLKDSSVRVAPVSKEEALTQIKDIVGFPILAGARGQDAVDLDALARAISSLSHLVLDYPEIEEIDLNPIFATPAGTVVVDARFMRTPPPAPPTE
jgi:acetyltransferase